MTGWIIGGILAAVVLIGCLRVGVQAEYDGQQLFVRLNIGPLRISLYPRTRKRREKPNQADAPKEPSPPSNQLGLDLSPRNLLHLLRVAGPEVWGLLRRLGRQLRVDRLHLHLTVGGTDPADVVLCYGQIHAVLGAVWQPLLELVCIKDGHIQVELDFEKPACEAEGTIALSLRMFALAGLVLSMAGRGIRVWRMLRQENRARTQDRKAA